MKIQKIVRIEPMNEFERWLKELQKLISRIVFGNYFYFKNPKCYLNVTSISHHAKSDKGTL
jgi:hypothetical protein